MLFHVTLSIRNLVSDELFIILDKPISSCHLTKKHRECLYVSIRKLNEISLDFL